MTRCDIRNYEIREEDGRKLDGKDRSKTAM